MRRKPAVAGYFYPSREKELLAMVGEMVEPEREKEKALCVVSPHAGFIYSGPVAGAVFSSVELPDFFVLLGPSHGGIISQAALMKEGIWETPLGDVPLERELAELIINNSSLVTEDAGAHSGEHSLEVQLPFIQYFKKNISIVPVVLSASISYPELQELGEAVAAGIKEFKKEVLIVASTDMSHYVSEKEAREKDTLAIDKVLALDPEGLFETVRKEGISMCGFQPTTAALVACRILGAKKAELVRYQTSGDTSGDYDQVVGYAGIRIN
ncbi:MAG: AmmeMemoRadiSam system protein B [Candidatus Aminicenantales bacterium]